MHKTTTIVIRLVLAVIKGDIDKILSLAREIVPKEDYGGFEEIIRGIIKGSR